MKVIIQIGLIKMETINVLNSQFSILNNTQQI